MLCWRWFCSKMIGKCSFNRKWLTMNEYKWLRQVKGDLKKAICIVCNKTITLTTMDKSVLRLLMAESKHQVNVKWNGTASTLKPLLQRKDLDYQKNICVATVNQEKDHTLSPNENMPLNIPPPPVTEVGSQFLGHTTANDMVQHFEKSEVNSGLPIGNLAQICINAPSVNLNFFLQI